MKPTLNLIGLLTLILFTQNLFAVRPEKREAKEEAFKRIEAYKPQERLKAYEAQEKDAVGEEEKKFWREKKEKVENEIKFWASLTRATSANSNQAGSDYAAKKTTQDISSAERATRNKESGTSHLVDAAINKAGRATVNKMTTEEMVHLMTEQFKKSQDANSADLLKRTYEEIKKSGSKEAMEGMNKLMEEIVNSKGDPEALLRGIAKLTEKNERDAKETLEIWRSTCADGCVPNRGACRIASQLWKQVAGAGVLAGVTLASFMIADITTEAPKDGKQVVKLSLTPKKDPAGEKKEISITIDDKEQAEEQFPGTPQKSS